MSFKDVVQQDTVEYVPALCDCGAESRIARQCLACYDKARKPTPTEDKLAKWLAAHPEWQRQSNESARAYARRQAKTMATMSGPRTVEREPREPADETWWVAHEKEIDERLKRGRAMTGRMLPRKARVRR